MERRGEGQRIGKAALFELSHADKEAIFVCLLLDLEMFPFDALLPVTRHRRETELAPEADALPGALLGGNKKGKMLAYETQADKISDVRDGNVLEDVDEQLVWQVGDWARGRRRVLNFRGRWLNL